MGIIRHRKQKPGDSAHEGVDRYSVVMNDLENGTHPMNNIRPASELPAYMKPLVENPMRSSAPQATPRMTIGSFNPDLKNTVPDTRAARKANSPKAKARALKAVNKKPLTPVKPGEEWLGSDAGFELSEPASTFSTAKSAERRLATGQSRSMIDGEKREADDKATVKKYAKTGKALSWSESAFSKPDKSAKAPKPKL